METLFSVIKLLNRGKWPLIFSTLIISASLWSCTNGGKKGQKDSADSISDTIVYSSDNNGYHADNDIAMTLKSIADALNQGEELDSLDYNYEGILTDGTGRTLYTDIQGSPGVWSIRVESPSTIAIKNLYLGDLLPESLENYIIQSFGLNETNRVDTSKFKNHYIENALVYHFEGGYLIFETQSALTPSGKEGPLMTIIATSDEIEE